MAIQSINSGNVSNAVPQIKQQNKNELDPNRQSINSAAIGDIVSITSTAQDIKNASDTGATAVNETRVADIKAILQDGNYKIDSVRVADKMLQMEKLLPNTT